MVQGVGRIEAGSSVYIGDALAASFVDHPVLQVSNPTPEHETTPVAPATEPVEQITVSVPAGEHVEIVPDAPAAPSQENAQ